MDAEVLRGGVVLAEAKVRRFHGRRCRSAWKRSQWRGGELRRASGARGGETGVLLNDCGSAG
jgi:hypothetical protein